MQSLCYFTPNTLFFKVDQSVMLTWVQPRVLDRQQVESMTKKIESWCQSVHTMEMMIDNKAGEILTY